MIKKNHLPYFKVKNEPEHFILARFLRRKFFPALRRRFPHHYLITGGHRAYLSFLKTTSKTHPYFLRFDIHKYFITVNHSILLSEIKSNYSQLSENPPSRRFRRFLKYRLPAFLRLSLYANQGLPLGNPLSHILAGIYLLKLDLNLDGPFLRFSDDYLLFGKTEGQIQRILTNVTNPILTELGLSLNIKKLKSGKFHRDSVTFLGFNYYAGYIRISEGKLEESKQRIREITHLTRKKSIPAIIKLLNNQILGFGHYYKFASAKRVFAELDSFVRSRLRRYVNRTKDSRDKGVNLIFTNQVLKELKLKSLEEIHQKHASKKRFKFRKSEKIRHKTGQGQPFRLQELVKISDKYRRKEVLAELKQLTNLVKKLVVKIDKIDGKLE